jgi:outer membrane protein assembly factor BamA
VPDTGDDTSAVGASSSTTGDPPGPVPPQGVSGLADRVKTRDRNAPRREERTAINLGNKHFNAVFGGLEQGASFGGGIELTTADSIPGIEFRLTAITSFKLYRRFEGAAHVPRIGDEKTHADVWFSYLRRTKDHFFGIGPQTRESSRTNYDVEQRSYQGVVSRDISDDFQVGIYGGVTNASNYRGQDDRDPPIDLIFSGDPNVVPITDFVPALGAGSKILDYGVYAEYNGRDNTRGLTRGVYLYGRFGSADGLDEDNVFSDYGWHEIELDARGYLPLGSDRTSLALRMLTEQKREKGGSQIPFYDLSRLGGRNYVRGFDTYRFHANNLLLFSIELRRTLYARKDDQGFDVAAFGDAGQPWGDNRSKTDPQVIQNDKFDSANWKFSLGGAAEFRFSAKLAFRVDVAHSAEANKVYFSVSRGF